MGIKEGHNVIWIISYLILSTPVTDEWFHRMEIKREKAAGRQHKKTTAMMMKNVYFILSPGKCFSCTILRVSVCLYECAYVWHLCLYLGLKNMKIHFCAFSDRFGFLSSRSLLFAVLLWSFVAQCIPLNQFNRNVFICWEKASKKAK